MFLISYFQLDDNKSCSDIGSVEVGQQEAMPGGGEMGGRGPERTWEGRGNRGLP